MTRQFFGIAESARHQKGIGILLATNDTADSDGFPSIAAVEKIQSLLGIGQKGIGAVGRKLIKVGRKKNAELFFAKLLIRPCFFCGVKLFSLLRKLHFFHNLLGGLQAKTADDYVG